MSRTHPTMKLLNRPSIAFIDYISYRQLIDHWLIVDIPNQVAPFLTKEMSLISESVEIIIWMNFILLFYPTIMDTEKAPSNVYVHNNRPYNRPLYWVHLLNCLVTQIANQPITWQQLNASRCGEDDLLKFKPSIRMGKKGDLMALFHCMVRHGTVRFTFGGFSTGYCTWYLILF